MLGIEDPWIGAVYILNIAAALFCILYGLVNWNRGAKHEKDEIEAELQWEAEEKEMEEFDI